MTVGYKRPTLKLEFEDPEMDGLEVRCRRPSIGAFMDLLGFWDRPLGDPEVRAEVAGEIRKALISWNLENDDDQAIPLTTEALLDLDTPMFKALYRAIVKVNSVLPVPLAGRSTAGGQFPVDSIPMEIRSPDLESSPAPN
jgi:hypothetical protein